MPAKTKRLCARCGWIGVGSCPNCRPASNRASDRRRGSSTERGYGSHWRRVVRIAFLRDNPLCVLCGALATVPDHYPETRASLVARGVRDPDDPSRLRALCKPCHDRHGLNGPTGRVEHPFG